MPADRPNDDPPLVSMCGIVKRFGSNAVLKKVDFDVRPGEVHALLGENGAGKSTLMKILLGVYKSDEGEIAFSGEKLHGASTRERLDAGVAMIFQELSLVPAMTVADNLFLGREPTKPGGRIDRRRIRAEAERAILEQGFSLSPSQRVIDMPFAARQQVEILKALSHGASVIVMDEPTSSLTMREERFLQATVAKLRDQGIGIVYISHRMSEIFQVADRLSVITDGMMQGPFAVAEVTIADVARMMVTKRAAGSDVSEPVKSDRRPGETVLKVDGLSTSRKLHDVRFEVRAGEVVGVAGLVGSGRSTLVKALFGLIKDSNGEIVLAGKSVSGLSVPKRIAAGMALVPEDRRHEGLVAQHSLASNVGLPNLADLMSGFAGAVSRRAENALFERFRKALNIASREPSQEVGELSGGNQQKIVFAKWLASKPRLLMLDEPTAGVDVNAKADMRALVRQAAEDGMAVLLVTSELDELASLSDRLLYMVDGRLAPVEANPRGEEDIRKVLQELTTVLETV